MTDEPFAECLNVGGVLVVSARSTGTRKAIERAGYSTEGLDISEFEKAEAGLTCLSLLF